MSKTRAAYKTESSGQQPQSLWNLPSLKTHPTLINAAHHLKKGSAPPHSESQQGGNTGRPAGAASWVPPGRETMEGEGQAPPQGQNLEAWDIPAGLGHPCWVSIGPPLRARVSPGIEVAWQAEGRAQGSQPQGEQGPILGPSTSCECPQ